MVLIEPTKYLKQIERGVGLREARAGFKCQLSPSNHLFLAREKSQSALI
jgi:hypothetical protein